MFDRCQRQWFFKTQLANPKAMDEMRRRAYRLSKLQSISAWRGSVVDQVLSQHVMPALERGAPITSGRTVALAMTRFDRQLAIARAHRLHEPGLKPSALGDDFVALHDLEYGGRVNEEDIDRARNEVRLSIEAFFSMEDLLSRLHAADRLVTQRSLTFTHADVTVRAVPDVVAFKSGSPPAIIDWKVHVFGWRDAWLQLAVYAAALTHSTPHKDFPMDPRQYRETDIELLEVQLLKHTIRRHSLTDEHFADADARIAENAERMLLALDGMNGRASTLPPTDFPAARYASVCQSCPYRSMCWEVMG